MRYILSIIATLMVANLWAQKLPERHQVRVGNKAYNKSEYKGAIDRYNRAKELAPTDFDVLYNYANALQKDEQYEAAEKQYTAINADSLATDKERADLYYNLGNSQFKQQKYKEALESYKNSIRMNPDDGEAKYNFAYTKALLDEQENQDNQDQQDQEQNQDQNDENQDGEDKQDQNQDKEQNQDQDKSDNKQNKQDEQQQQPADGQISPQEQQQMLDAIQAQEDKTQEKLDEKAKGTVIPGAKNW